MKKRKKKERILPMPTEEDKKRAQLKAKSADPLVWAMKNVDDEFPDAREKDAQTLKAEAEVEMTEGSAIEESASEEVVDENPTEIRAEGKTTMPTSDGVMTVEVAPMRQNVDGVSRDEIPKNDSVEDASIEKPEENSDKKVKKANSINTSEKSDSHRTQVKLTALEAKQKKMMIGLFVLVILAIGGVAFGVVAMINQNNATLELANQIANNSTTVHEDQVDDEYIYLKDWALKIKIPSGLSNVSFDYDNGDYPAVLIWGTRKDNGANYVPDFAKQSKNGNALGTVTRVPRYERAAAGRLIWYDDYYNYYYQGPTGEPNASESEMDWWVESYLLIKEMLTNADNYIKFDE